LRIFGKLFSHFYLLDFTILRSNLPYIKETFFILKVQSYKKLRACLNFPQKVFFYSASFALLFSLFLLFWLIIARYLFLKTGMSPQKNVI